MSETALRETMSRQVASPLSPSPKADFAEATSVAALAMRKALSTLVSALPGNVRRPRDMERALGLDYKLCWHVFNVIRAPDGLSAAKQVPKKLSIQRLLDAASRADVTEEITQAIRDASEHFEEAVRVHAGDRVVFDAMVNGAAATDGGGADLIERRSAFRNNSHIWGLQVETFFTTVIYRKNPTGLGIDHCHLMSRLGFRRLRGDSSKIVYRYRPVRGNEIGVENIQHAIDQEFAEKYGAPLLPDFCTKPLPRFTEAALELGWVTHELESDAIGRQAEVDLTFGSMRYNDMADVLPDGQQILLSAVSYQVPARRVIQSMVIHRPSFGIIEPEMFVYGVVPGHELPVIPKAAPRLPIRADVVRVEGGIDGVQTPEAPRMGELITYACNKLGWNTEEFDVYQITLDYPVLHSVTRIEFSYR